MTGHHLIISGEGAPHIRCAEPSTASCHAVYDCDCGYYYDYDFTGDGVPCHLPQPGAGEIHMARLDPAYCDIAEWFSEFGADALLSGEHSIPLRVAWGIDGPTLHLPRTDQGDPMTTLPPHPGLSGLAAREATTSADITRAADDDADHVRSEFTGQHLDRIAALSRRHGLYADPVPCGCCGPQLCCCDRHKEEA